MELDLLVRRETLVIQEAQVCQDLWELLGLKAMQESMEILDKQVHKETQVRQAVLE